ncbi:MAG: orotidine 5'-phosphate decarboxylase, partial [Candidatus Omnitrophica bacterium]|nr:orotidine 5'-phosphate decarboxylase [Candidatus Omnitrophota bacterium]
MKKKTALIVALDVPGLNEAETIVKKLSPAVKYFKIGMQLFTACGPSVVEMVHSHKREVFLDLKFHDIPNTVAQAAISSLRLGVFMFNVHAIGG